MDMDDADRVLIKVGEMDPVDSGLLPGLFAEAEKRGFWLRVKNTNVSPLPCHPCHQTQLLPLPRILQFQSKTVVSLHPAGNLDWNKESIVEVSSNIKQQKIIILFRVLSPVLVFLIQLEIHEEEDVPESWEFAFVSTSTPILLATDCRSTTPPTRAAVDFLTNSQNSLKTKVTIGRCLLSHK